MVQNLCPILNQNTSFNTFIDLMALLYQLMSKSHYFCIDTRESLLLTKDLHSLLVR